MYGDREGQKILKLTKLLSLRKCS